MSKTNLKNPRELKLTRTNVSFLFVCLINLFTYGSFHFKLRKQNHLYDNKI